jgi:hypothetical protein
MAFPGQQQLATLLNFRAQILASFYFRGSKFSLQANDSTSSANVAVKPSLKYKQFDKMNTHYSNQKGSIIH